MRSSQIAGKIFVVTILLCAFPWRVQTATESGLKVFSLPAAQPTPPKTPTPGYSLVGGGRDVDEAMKFLCQNSGGGNIVILRASGDDDYNPYFHTLCPHNSVTTLLITSAEGARDPIAADQIRNAHAIFIAGGDQSNYLKDWSGNPVQAELNAAIARGVPIGGISAGLAVLGEFVFSARMDTVDEPPGSCQSLRSTRYVGSQLSCDFPVSGNHHGQPFHGARTYGTNASLSLSHRARRLGYARPGYWHRRGHGSSSGR